jgi:hypothetical protein
VRFCKGVEPVRDGAIIFLMRVKECASITYTGSTFYIIIIDFNNISNGNIM